MTKACHILHQRLGQLPRFVGFKLPDALPTDGVYVVFERGEKAHGVDRIVRVGTHRGVGKLKARLLEHCREPGRSIFRKHIGRCLLSDSPEMLENWNLRSVKRDDWDRNSTIIDWGAREVLHLEISNYIRQNLRFACFAVADKQKRHAIETRILSTIAQCEECGPSKQWLGLRHQRDKIRAGGLWNVQGMNGQPMTGREAAQLELARK